MSRYHTLDTHTGVIVQESNWLPSEQAKASYKRSQPRSRFHYRPRHRHTSAEGRLAIVGVSCLVLGMILG